MLLNEINDRKSAVVTRETKEAAASVTKVDSNDEVSIQYPVDGLANTVTSVAA